MRDYMKSRSSSPRTTVIVLAIFKLHNCKFKPYNQFLRYLTARPVLNIREKWGNSRTDGIEGNREGQRGCYVNTTPVTLPVFT